MELRVLIDDDRFTRMIAGLRHRVNSLEPAMRLVGQAVCESIDDTFAAEGRPEAWEALADRTLASKKPGLRILEGETGRLREGIHVEEVGKNFVDVAPDALPYARIQQLGGEAGKGATIPARPYLVLQGSDAGRIEEIITDYIMGDNA
ncbi:MAG: phage virion morphogenesis protein [Thermodesulfobacteriota bacterium]